MKKLELNLSKLDFEKEKIGSLQDFEGKKLLGGNGPIKDNKPATGGFSSGCSDGCTTLGTVYNCTECYCSKDCSLSFCPLTNTGHPGTLC